ncbi:MAG: GTPase [Crocinitomicaceae bacterium]|nr:GTPase [Crocinitomicaceae bacterium]
MELLFVYNAEKDLINGAIDYVHKVFKPSTYKCDLCQLTYHNLGQRSSWKKFRKSTNADISFYYFKGFEKKFNESHDYPVVLRRDNGENTVVLNRQELSDIDTVEDLISRIQKIIKKH